MAGRCQYIQQRSLIPLAMSRQLVKGFILVLVTIVLYQAVSLVHP